MKRASRLAGDASRRAGKSLIAVSGDPTLEIDETIPGEGIELVEA